MTNKVLLLTDQRNEAWEQMTMVWNPVLRGYEVYVIPKRVVEHIRLQVIVDRFAAKL